MRKDGGTSAREAKAERGPGKGAPPRGRTEAAPKGAAGGNAFADALRGKFRQYRRAEAESGRHARHRPPPRATKATRGGGQQAHAA
jgi:hypothetical protein